MPTSDNMQAELLYSILLDRIELAYSKAHIERGAATLITTAAQRWSYAASLPLAVDPAGGPNLAVDIRLRVLAGKVGVGVLATDGQSFVVEKEVAVTHAPGENLVLCLPCPPVVGPLIVRNVSEVGSSKVALEQVAICRISAQAEMTESESLSACEPSRDDLPLLVQSLEYLRPLVPYPGWRFDSDWHNPDFSFQTRRRLWEYCFLKHWDVLVDLPWYGGIRLELPLLSDAGRQLFVSGCIDPNEFSFLDRVLTPEMVFVDVGAHVGLYALYAARRTAAVWAFEPSSREFARLQNNVRRNMLPCAQAVQVGLGAADGVAELRIADAMHSGQNTIHSFCYEGVVSEGIETVEMRRLDHFVAENKLDRIDVLKVDVEQSELEVLRGAVEVLRSMHPWLLLEVVQRQNTSALARARESLSLLEDLGYILYRIDPRTGLVARASPSDLPENLIAASVHNPLPQDAMAPRKYFFKPRQRG